MISFQTFLYGHSSPLWSNLLRLQCTCCTIPTTFGRPHGSPLVWACVTSLLLPHLPLSLTDSLHSLNLLCHSKTDARFMQDGWKAVWSIPYVSVAFFPSLKHNFIAYRSSKVSDCIFEIHQLWQSGFSGVYSNCCCSCSFEPEIIIIGQSSHKMYSNNILNFQESMTILNAQMKKVWKLIVCTAYLCEQTYYIQTHHLVGMKGSVTDSLQEMGPVLNIWWGLTG